MPHKKKLVQSSFIHTHTHKTTPSDGVLWVHCSTVRILGTRARTRARTRTQTVTTLRPSYPATQIRAASRLLFARPPTTARRMLPVVVTTAAKVATKGGVPLTTFEDPAETCRRLPLPVQHRMVSLSSEHCMSEMASMLTR